MNRPDVGARKPELVVLIGPAGAGKSTWAAARYQPHQVHSLDGLRAVVADDECDQDATADARTILAAIVDARLSRRLTTVVDATSTSAADRAWLLALAARHQVPAAAVVFLAPLQVCLARQAGRPGPAPGRRWGRAVPAAVVRDQHAHTLDSLNTLRAEGFTRIVHVDVDQEEPMPDPGTPVPDTVLQAHNSYVDPAGWRWESDVRLTGPHRQPNTVVLVALAADHSHWMSQASADTPAARAEAWSRLEALLAADLAGRDGCRAGDPLTRDDDPARCRWCGIAVDAHELPADVGAGATYQAPRLCS